MWNLKYDTNELIYKAETDSQTQKSNLWLPKGMGVGRDKLGVWDQQIQTTTYKLDKQGPTVQHSRIENIQYPVINQNKKNMKKIYIYN